MHRHIRSAACALLATMPFTVAAQSYPAKPVRVIIPWPAGGLTDVAGRIIVQKMGENLGQSFVVDNRGGATGTIGADLVAKSPADGYTLMVHSTSHVANAHLYAKLPYDTLRDFTPIGLLVAQTGLLVVHPSLPVKNVKELVALARAKPDQVLYASSGAGSFSHLAIALLTSMTNTKMLHVPYKGAVRRRPRSSPEKRSFSSAVPPPSYRICRRSGCDCWPSVRTRGCRSSPIRRPSPKPACPATNSARGWRCSVPPVCRGPSSIASMRRSRKCRTVGTTASTPSSRGA